MHLSDITYRFHQHRFQHNLGADFGLFAVWADARPYLNDIRRILTERFEVLLETDVTWSEACFEKNAARLYEAPYYRHEGAPAAKGHRQKLKERTFTVFVIKDDTPDYTHAQSVSGKIELSNVRVVETKYALRDFVREKTGERYAVHSTNSIDEFFFQAPLVLGTELFHRILEGKPFSTKPLEQDLVGANGWRNYQEFFDILNLTTNYLVLRGFESLPERNPEPDLDVLTTNYQRFASAIGAEQNRTMPFKAHVRIGDESVSLDIRHVGDKYYDAVWAQRMLDTKVERRGVYIPRDDHYFFSLLFHAKVQKLQVKPKYHDVLKTLARTMGYVWYKPTLLDDNESMGKILHGFFDAQGYQYEDPLDGHVGKNLSVIAILPQPLRYSAKYAFKTKMKVYVRKIIPEPFVPVVKNILRK